MWGFTVNIVDTHTHTFNRSVGLRKDMCTLHNIVHGRRSMCSCDAGWICFHCICLSFFLLSLQEIRGGKSYEKVSDFKHTLTGSHTCIHILADAHTHTRRLTHTHRHTHSRTDSHAYMLTQSGTHRLTPTYIH